MCRRDSLLTWLINWQFGLQACNCIKCLYLILWLQALKGLWSIPSLLHSNVEVWRSKITLGSGFPGSMISCFHSRRHSCPWYHDTPRTGDLKLTRYYSRYPNIIFFTMKKGIFLTKAVNYFGKPCTAALRSNCSPNCSPNWFPLYHTAVQVAWTILYYDSLVPCRSRRTGVCTVLRLYYWLPWAAHLIQSLLTFPPTRPGNRLC